MNKGDLQRMTGLSSSTIAKLGKNEVVKIDIIDRICCELQCQIYDVVEIITEESNKSTTLAGKPIQIV